MLCGVQSQKQTEFGFLTAFQSVFLYIIYD